MPKIIVNKQRLPEIARSLYGRYMKISKADWADLYFNLLRQVYGEAMRDEEIMQDAENRLDILKFFREK
jgi:hypothetical protein